MIQIKNLVKNYADQPVIRGLDLEVSRGRVLVIIGPSGSGKSTLLRCINGLEAFQGGEVRIGSLALTPSSFDESNFNSIVRPVRLAVGMVFQALNLFPHLNALDNVTLAPRKVLRRDREEAEQRALQLLKRVNLDGKEKQYPASLSGGEQQRVAIARALAMDPQVILFDEPTSALDPELTGEVLAVIADLASEGYTMIITTHQMHFAKRSAHEVIFLDEGAVAEAGSPDSLFDSPKTVRLQRFLENLQAGA